MPREGMFYMYTRFHTLLKELCTDKKSTNVAFKSCKNDHIYNMSHNNVIITSGGTGDFL